MGKKPTNAAKAMLRVTTKTRDTLRDIAEGTGCSMQRVAEEAVEAYRRQMILDQTHAAYARLVQDPQAWAEVQAERSEWDVTLGDGLEDE